MSLTASAIDQAGFAARISARRTRVLIYVAMTLALLAVGWTTRLLAAHHLHKPVDFVIDDAEGYYVYLPALVIHGDLDFHKEILHRQSSSHPTDNKAFFRSDGSSMDRWPIGVALTISPAFLFAHALSTVVFSHTLNWRYQADGYTIIYQACCATWATALGLITMLCADDLIKARGFSDRCTVAGILTYVLGTNFVYYMIREPLMAHMASTAWLLIAIWCADRIARTGASLRTLGMLGAFAVGMAAVCRLTNVVIVAPIAILLLIRLRQQGRTIEIINALPWLAVALVPMLAQALVWRALNGGILAHNVQTIGYRPEEGFLWTRPQWWRTLISSRHGLFFWSPLLLFSIWGLVIDYRRRHDPLIVAWLIAALMLWYLNSAWFYWSFGDSFGARSFLELAGFFMLGTTAAYHWLANQRRIARWAIGSAILLCCGYSWVMMALYITQRIPRDAPLW
jgi:hypothetical protein